MAQDLGTEDSPAPEAWDLLLVEWPGSVKPRPIALGGRWAVSGEIAVSMN